MNWLKENYLPIFIGALGLVLILFGILQFFSHASSKSSSLEFQSSQTDTSVKSEVIVDVEGAVIKPGVYKLASDSRIVDALAKAGGMSEEADRVYVEKSMNLAAKVSDGLKIYVPRSGESIISASSINGSASVININSASSSELDQLPGIGTVTAEKIIQGRPYAKTDDLLSKKIVGSKVYDQIKDKISAN